MRTALEVSFTHTCEIPGLRAVVHDFPGFSNITCIDFVNEGNKDLPPTMQHIMLVPEGFPAPDLGRDRTHYTVPADYTDIELVIQLGIVGDKDFLVAQLTIGRSDGASIPLTHIPCELP